MDERDDQDTAGLVRLAAAGDGVAFGELVRRYRSLAVGVARRVLGDPHEAEDVAQEAFVRAWTALPELENAARFPAWVARIAGNLARNRRRARRLHPVPEGEAVASEGHPAREAEAAEFAAAVLAAIERLPPAWRAPVELRHVQGLPLRVIADRLGLAPGAVRTRLCRARRDLARRLYGWPADVIGRSKEARGWLPALLSFPLPETNPMPLTARATRRPLPRGERTVTIRPLRREDLPALRRFDEELMRGLAAVNAAMPPGATTSIGGGPWSDDEWLAQHFEKYEARGDLTLLAESEGRVVGFSDLWTADEPPPFGRSLNVECIDYLREYHLLGLERILLEEAEKVARAAGLPALDIGTNTASGDYPSLRRFGLRVFYEYDLALCARPTSGPAPTPSTRPLSPSTADLSGLLKVSHWSPTDFSFRGENAESRLFGFEIGDTRALLELWRYEEEKDVGRVSPVPPRVPNRTELWVSAEAVDDAQAMSDVLAACVALAAEAGAEEIPLPVPSGLSVDPGAVDVRSREFEYAWLRKVLA